ncbi:MAG: imidazole glycerol phosphate synthase subunit HisH [Candidatus Magnetoovum sp. WYHC-5]|nr:imidazole glycerol phosphate synthase subunit HisH [Candidatus Magnetoovum sp. WYHC-5]
MYNTYLMIAIIDYGMGNLKSVQKAFQKVGADAVVTSKPVDLQEASGIVLPGVGAFRDCMANLSRLGFVDAVIRDVEKGKPYLGICLGLQILMSDSEEFGLTHGLDIIKGKVVRFPQSNLKVPHMGWNKVKIIRKPPVFDNIDDGQFFYFVHSYHVVCDDSAVVAAVTDYGYEFTSMIWKDNIMATQFHPEKSDKAGLLILKNFSHFVKHCQ